MKRMLVALALLAACSSEKTTTTQSSAASASPQGAPNAAQAAAIIAKSNEFSQYEFTNAAISLPMVGSSKNAASQALVQQLANAGWLAVDGTGDLMLTDKSRSERRFIIRENGLLDIVPLARKEMGTVTAVRTNADGTINADFDWTWLPNDIGSSFTSGPIFDRFSGTQKASANLMWNGTEWTMIAVEKK